MPVNVSASPQTIVGSLTLGGGFAAGDATNNSIFTRLLGPVGIGVTPPTGTDGVVVDVNGQALANDFCLRNADGTESNTCFSTYFSTYAPPASISAIKDIFPGTGIRFINSAGGASTNFIGASVGGKSAIYDGTIIRDFTVNPCPNSSNVFLNSIDPNGFATCAAAPTGTSGLTSIVNFLGDASIIVPATPLSGIWDLGVNGAVIQASINGCGPGQTGTGAGTGQAIGKIAYPSNATTCVPVGYSSQTSYCSLNSATRIFTCINNGATISIYIPGPPPSGA